MLSTDPIADMLTRIRNAIAVNKNEIAVPYSKVKETVAQQLKESNFLDAVSTEEEEDGNKNIIIAINNPEENARITELHRISKPGRRIYAKANEIPRVKSGRGVVIISTSKGMMNGSEAVKQRLGGELICKVY